MTNTKNPAPTQTGSKGIACGRCSHGFGKDRVVIRHASVAAVRACFAAPAVPVVAVPEAPAPVIDTTPKAYGRWFAKCTQKGCKHREVRSSKFRFQCPDHKWVRVQAKQLVGKFSTAEKHKCDPRCTGAVGPTCTCQCGGVNHGVDLLVKIV